MLADSPCVNITSSMDDKVVDRSDERVYGIAPNISGRTQRKWLAERTPAEAQRLFYGVCLLSPR